MTSSLWIVVALLAALCCVRFVQDACVIPSNLSLKKMSQFFIAVALALVCALGAILFQAYQLRLSKDRGRASNVAQNLVQGVAGPPLSLDIANELVLFCKKNNASCVIDFTAKTLCSSRLPELLNHIETLDERLDRFVSICAMYHWKKDGDVYVIEPRNKSDSALNIPVGPITNTCSAYSLMQEFHFSAVLPSRGSHGFFGGGLASMPKVGRKVSYTLPRDTFKNNLIRAAKQSGRTYWVVRRSPDNTFEFQANDFDSASL